MLALHRSSGRCSAWSQKSTISVLFNFRSELMLRISKLTDYAIVAMTFLAERPEGRFSAAEIAGKIQLEVPTVAKILKLLATGNLVQPYRGVNGGYQLQGAAAEITVADIITVMEGPIGMTECSVHEGSCAQEPICRTRSNWRRISQAVAAALAEVTLLEMTASFDVPSAPAGLTIRLANK